jgi:hypothetical protein
MEWINKKFTQSKDRRLIAGAVFFMLVFTLMFLSDKFIFEQNNQLTPIGHVIRYNKDIQRKNIDQFIWQALVPRQRVFHNDSFFTGENSNVLIVLSGGLQIEVQENTLIQFNENTGIPVLHLMSGSFSAKVPAGQALAVEQNQGPTLVKAAALSQVHFNKSAAQKIDIEVETGSIHVAELEATAARPVVIDHGIVHLQTKVQIELDKLTPKFMEIVDGEKPLLRYKMTGPARHSYLQFKSLDKIQHSFQVPIKNKRIIWPKQFTSGHYQVQIFAMSSSGVLVASNAREIQLEHLQIPQLIPTSTTANSGDAINLQWTSQANAQSFLVELSNSEGLIENFITDTPTLLVPNLPAGKYWLRLRAQGKTKQTSYSEKQPFEVIHRSKDIFEFTGHTIAKTQLNLENR